MKEQFVLTEYQLTADLPQPMTLALVTDLHERDPAPVLALLREAAPDLILVAGDIFERNESGRDPRSRTDYGTVSRLTHSMMLWLDGLLARLVGSASRAPANASRFIREAARIAPVYLSLGNHEWYLEEQDRALFAQTGVTLLDNRDAAVRVKGNTLRIGGLSPRVDLDWLEGFSDKDDYKMLLCHHPEYYERYVREKSIDLMLSGHAHGGQIRILGRGIFSPGQGLLPKYTRGVYDSRLVVSAGCANTACIPRWGNPCEVVAVRLESWDNDRTVGQEP